MSVSFKITRVGSRYRPSIPPSADPPESVEGDAELHPRDRVPGREWSGDTEVSFLGPDDKFGCFPICTTLGGKKSFEAENEASFSLNLYPNGFFIGKPTEGILLPVLEDVPKLLHPYDRASKTLFSAIENGCLPGDILDGIPCKYYNGNLFCEKVCLRMGSENVIKDMQSISNASWTYSDLLEVESQIIKFMHPELYLSTKPSFDRLCKEPAPKVDLGIFKGELIKEQHDNTETDSEPVDIDISRCGLKPQESGSLKHGTSDYSQNNMRSGTFTQQSKDMKSTIFCGIQIASKSCKASDVGCSVSIKNTAADVPSVLLPPNNDQKDCFLHTKYNAESTCSAVKRAKRWLPALDPPQIKEDSWPGQEGQTRGRISQQQEVRICECVDISDQHCSTNKFSTTKILEVEPQMVSHLHGTQKGIIKDELQPNVLCKPYIGKDKEEISLDLGNKKPKQRLDRRSHPRGLCDHRLSVEQPKRRNTSRKRKLTKNSQISSEILYQHQVSRFGKNQTSQRTPGSTHPEIAATKDLSDVSNVSALHERFSKIKMIAQRFGLNIKKNKADKYLTRKLSPSCLIPPVRLLAISDGEETGRCRHTWKIRILTYKRVQFSFAGTNLPFSASESWCKLVLSQPSELSDHEVGAENIYLTEDRHCHVVFLPTPHYADLFAAQFTSLMEKDGYQLMNDQLLDSSHATCDSSFGSSTQTGSSGFASLPVTTAGIGHPSRTPALIDGVSSMHMHQCPQILAARVPPSLNLTMPQAMASPDFNFMQQQIPMGFMSRPLAEMSLGDVSIPSSHGFVPLIPSQQCPHQPRGILQNKMASVRSSNDTVGGEARVSNSAIPEKISTFNNPRVPVPDIGMSPLLLNKPVMDLHSNISRPQHRLYLDSQRSSFSAQQQRSAAVFPRMRGPASVSSQMFLPVEGRQFVSGTANAGSPQLSSQTAGSAGTINSPSDSVVMKEDDNSSKGTA